MNTVADAKKFAQTMARKYTGNKKTCSAACETTGNMWNITYAKFEAAGIPIKLANTYKMAIIAKTGKKTDKVDAQKIAQVLRMDMIPECYVPKPDIRGIRAMIRQHIKIVHDRTRVINRVRSLLDRHDVSIDTVQVYAVKTMQYLESVSLDEIHDEIILQQYVRQIRHLTEELTKMNDYIEQEAANNEYAKLLTSMTGMGTYTSLLLAVEIADISRFDNPKKLVAWAGLCPTIHQSGDQKYLGRMKKLDTNSIVNWAMCEAANVAVIHDPRMKSIYESAKRRHADKHALAVVAVANKMITISWHILNTKTPYSSHNTRLYQRKLAKLEKARQK